jgi:hypothetical protein
MPMTRHAQAQWKRAPARCYAAGYHTAQRNPEGSPRKWMIRRQPEWTSSSSSCFPEPPRWRTHGREQRPHFDGQRPDCRWHTQTSPSWSCWCAESSDPSTLPSMPRLATTSVICYYSSEHSAKPQGWVLRWHGCNQLAVRPVEDERQVDLVDPAIQPRPDQPHRLDQGQHQAGQLRPHDAHPQEPAASRPRHAFRAAGARR